MHVFTENFHLTGQVTVNLPLLVFVVNPSKSSNHSFVQFGFLISPRPPQFCARIFHDPDFFAQSRGGRREDEPVVERSDTTGKQAKRISHPGGMPVLRSCLLSNEMPATPGRGRDTSAGR